MSASDPINSTSTAPRRSHYTPCSEHSVVRIALIISLAITILGTICVLSLYHPEGGSLGSFFSRVRQGVQYVAHKLDCSAYDSSLFILTIGITGSTASLIWRARLCCLPQQKQPI